MKKLLTLLALAFTVSGYSQGIQRNSFTTNNQLQADLRGDLRWVKQLGSLKESLLSTNTRLIIVGDSYSNPGETYYSMPRYLVEMLRAQFGNNGSILENLDLNGFDDSTIAEQYLATNWYGQLAYVITNSAPVKKWQSTQTGYANNTGFIPNNLDSATKVGLYWLAIPNGGNFTIQCADGSGNYTNITVSGYAASRVLRHTNWVPRAATANVVTLTNITGTNLILGAEYVNDTRSGLQTAWFQHGSTSMADMTNAGVDLMQSLAAEFQPTHILYFARDDGELSESANSNLLKTVMGALSVSGTTPIIVGAPPYVSSDTTILRSQNLAYQRICEASNWMFIDLRADFPSASSMTNQAMLLGDGLHPTQYGAKLWAGTVAARLGITAPVSASTIPDLLTNVTAARLSPSSTTSNLVVGTSDINSPGLEVLQANGTASAYLGNLVGASGYSALYLLPNLVPNNFTYAMLSDGLTFQRFNTYSGGSFQFYIANATSIGSWNLAGLSVTGTLTSVGTNSQTGVVTNVVGSTVMGQIPINVNGVTYYIELKK